AQGIEVRRSASGFTHEGRAYLPGTFVVPMAQPKMGAVRWLLGRTLYPDNSHTRSRSGAPIGPYDMATDNMAEFMGVQVDPVDAPLRAELVRLTGDVVPEGRLSQGQHGYVLDGRLNASFRAVSLLLDRGVAVRRVRRQDAPGMSPGDFVVPASA